MLLTAWMLWFEETPEGCAVMTRALAEDAAVVGPTLAGSCDVSAIARGDADLLVLRGFGDTGSVWRVSADEPLDLGSPPAAARQVAWAADGAPMVLTADFDRGQPEADFEVTTWVWRDAAWTEVERGVERVDSVRLVRGGPTWQARRADASVDRWQLELAPGFSLAAADDLRPPARVARAEPVAWGRVPFGDGEVVVAYGFLGGPLPVGPVLWHRGKRWRLLDDSRLLETPASVQVAGDHALVSYEGRSPLLLDARTGGVVWRPGRGTAHGGERAWINGALLW
jgi:hypothetical protein